MKMKNRKQIIIKVAFLYILFNSVLLFSQDVVLDRVAFINGKSYDVSFLKKSKKCTNKYYHKTNYVDIYYRNISYNGKIGFKINGKLITKKFHSIQNDEAIVFDTLIHRIMLNDTMKELKIELIFYKYNTIYSFNVPDYKNVKQVLIFPDYLIKNNYKTDLIDVTLRYIDRKQMKDIVKCNKRHNIN